MNILFDCTSTQPEYGITVNGGGEYSTRILCELLHKSKSRFTLLFSQRKGNNLFIEEIAKKNNLVCEWYNDYQSLSSIANNCYEIVFFPIFYPSYSSLTIRNDVKIIGFIHDLSMFYEYLLLTAKGEFYKQDGLNWLRFLKKIVLRKYYMKKYLSQHIKLFDLNNNTSIYTVSYYSKYAIEYFCQKKIKGVFYSPLNEYNISFQTIDEEATLSKYAIDKDSYFLLVSASRWIKNNFMAIKAFDELMEKGILNDKSNIKIVVLGCTEKFTKYLKKNIKNKDRFVLCDFVDKKELNILYKNAYSFVYPSLLEGFGYPPIEAMRYGTLSICSTSTSIPEICGDAVIYFNPRKIESFKMAVMRSFDDDYYKFIKKRIVRHYELLKEKQESDLKKLIDLIE